MPFPPAWRKPNKIQEFITSLTRRNKASLGLVRTRAGFSARGLNKLELSFRCRPPRASARYKYRRCEKGERSRWIASTRERRRRRRELRVSTCVYLASRGRARERAKRERERERGRERRGIERIFFPSFASPSRAVETTKIYTELYFWEKFFLLLCKCKIVKKITIR